MKRNSGLKSLLPLLLLVILFGCSEDAKSDAPTNLRILAVYGTVVELAWDSATQSDTFFIYGVGPNYSQITGASASSGTTQYGSVTGLSLNQSYTFFVTAYNNYTESGHSNTVKAITGAVIPAPTGLAVTAHSPISITLSWTGVAGSGQNSYSVYRRNAPFNNWEECIHSLGSTSYPDTDVYPGETYDYKVVYFENSPRTGNHWDESNPSNIVTATAAP